MTFSNAPALDRLIRGRHRPILRRTAIARRVNFRPFLRRTAGAWRIYLRPFLRRLVGAWRIYLRPVCLLPLLLAGCQGQHTHRGPALTAAAQSQLNVLPNRFAAECNELWQTDNAASLEDPAYWLRAMQCAERITPTQARAEAALQSGETWHDAFKQSILLNAAGISVIERREAYQRLLEYRSQFPADVYPLFKIWRQQQALRLILADERARNQHQQEANASQIETLRIQQIELQRKLDVTTRKLQNLTEIEQRLSARKQQSPDAQDADDNDAPPPVSGSSRLLNGQQQGSDKK